jgi:hypothetical protein
MRLNLLQKAKNLLTSEASFLLKFPAAMDLYKFWANVLYGYICTVTNACAAMGGCPGL